VLPKIAELMSDGGEAVVLIKPQFEAGKKDIGKKGVVKDRKVHERVLSDTDSAMRLAGLVPVGYTYSPVKGGSGNIEYLAHLRRDASVSADTDLRKLVGDAFAEL